MFVCGFVTIINIDQVSNNALCKYGNCFTKVEALTCAVHSDNQPASLSKSSTCAVHSSFNNYLPHKGNKAIRDLSLVLLPVSSILVGAEAIVSVCAVHQQYQKVYRLEVRDR